MNKLDDIYEILKQNEKYIDNEGNILKSVVQTDAMNLNEDLLSLLLSNETTKDMFFKDINGIFVFDKIAFSWTINNKMFLPDSYTSFKNKIGLIDSNMDYIVNSNDVVLSFPYKDCVLEFDSTKETEERNEVFFNEVLMKKEIDTLLAPKTFSNAKKYYEKVEEELISFDVNDNLVIKGNNLIAMQSLLPVYAGKIKLMYWDILYNTNNDQVPYNDSFKHSSWLTMMKNRLEVAQKLLRDDGIICLQCDDNEQAYLKVLCDEIFGRNAFINCICVKSSEASGTKMSHVEKKFPKIKDYLIIYKKNENAIIKINPVKVDNTENIDEFLKYAKYYSKIIINKDVPVENWEIISIKDYIKKNHPDIDIGDEKAVLKFKIENADRIVYRTNNKSFDKYNFDTITAEIISPNGLKYIWWEGKQMLFLSDYTSSYLCDIWDDISTINLNKEGNVELKAGKKPEKLLERIIACFTKNGDIVLDSYFGTGTTGSVALKMNRKFIGLEQLDDHYKKAIKRLIGVINGESSGISKEVNWQGGGSFTAFELSKLNEVYLDKINNVKNDNELLTLFNEIIESDFITYRVNINKITSNFDEFTSLSLDDKKKLLIEILDKNLLYINYSDIDDKNYAVSEKDKSFTKSFYEGK